ncbi:MAG TPA: transposase [Opitutaceae bacterium]|nr:transposase [Opitutaceae bacterium]
MARKLRLEYAGACYHVINRGNYRRDLFAGKGAAESFEKCLFEAAARFGWRLHAFVIMRNHFHLAVETPEPNLSEGMKWLQGTWAARFNRFRGEGGRPFQGRYKALHVEPGHSLAQVAHYIHLNPVRAKVKKAEELREFRWSSLSWLLKNKRPDWLAPETVLFESGGLPDTPAGWRRYLGYLAVLAEEESRLREEKFSRLSRGWAIGSKEFRTGLKKDLAEEGRERFGLLGADPAAHRQVRAELWEQKLADGAKALGVDLARLPAQRSAPEKVELAALMKSATSVSNDWLAETLAMGKPASVSQYVRRFRLAGGLENRGFKTALSRVKT